MNFRYITIEREYGSGGTEIARQIAANAGVPCYGREIVEQASKTLNMSVEDIEKNEENVTGSLLYTIYMMAQAHSGNADMLTKEGQIYVAEQEEIRRLAKQGSAVFLGHCASEALKDENGVLKVFIRCTDNDMKQHRIIRDYGINAGEVERVKEHFDKKRANYYHANTSKKWRDYDNYDIVLDSGRLGTEGCIVALGGLLF
jgi:cytidylate kinase